MTPKLPELRFFCNCHVFCVFVFTVIVSMSRRANVITVKFEKTGVHCGFKGTKNFQ